MGMISGGLLPNCFINRGMLCKWMKRLVIDTGIDTNMNVCTYIYIHTYIHACIYIYTHLQLHIHTAKHVHTIVCLCIYTLPPRLAMGA